MRRIAAHYVYWKGVHQMSYLELGENDTFRGVFPLVEEIASTAFYDGILLPITEGSPKTVQSALCALQEVHDEATLFDLLALFTATRPVEPGCIVQVIRLSGITAPAAKLSTNNSCRNCHIERL